MKNLEIFDKDGNQLAIMDVISMRPITVLEGVTRVEVIDQQGRSYTNMDSNNIVEISMQDDCRTMKIFIGSKGTWSIANTDNI